MQTSFESLLARARELQKEIDGLDRDDQIIEIVRVLSDVLTAGRRDAIDALEIKLLHQGHH